MPRAGSSRKATGTQDMAITVAEHGILIDGIRAQLRDNAAILGELRADIKSFGKALSESLVAMANSRAERAETCPWKTPLEKAIEATARDLHATFADSCRAIQQQLDRRFGDLEAYRSEREKREAIWTTEHDKVSRVETIGTGVKWTLAGLAGAATIVTLTLGLLHLVQVIK